MHNSKASLFLMELMVVILFFSISSAVCIQLFVKSHMITNTAQAQSNANMIAQNTSECFLSTDGSMGQTLPYLNEHNDSQNNISTYYNADWNICKTEEAMYMEVLTFTSDEHYNYMAINISDILNEENLYNFTLKKYKKETIK